MGPSGNSVKTDAAQDAGVGQVGAGGDDAVGDGVVDGLDGESLVSHTHTPAGSLRGSKGRADREGKTRAQHTL